MSFAMRGITHCIECGTPLSMCEHYRCSSCEEEYQKEIEKNKLNEIVEKMVKNELAKRTKEIVNLEITIDNRKEKISGYWEDKYTKFVVIK